MQIDIHNIQMSYGEAKRILSNIETQIAIFSEMLKQYPTGALGLTPDYVKELPTWQAAKKGYDAAFANLRGFNSMFVKTFKKEIRKERRARS